MTTKNVTFLSGAALNTFVSKAISAYKHGGELIHQACVQAIAHVAEHGNTTPLNNIYAALRSNDQSALKLAITRIKLEIGGAKLFEDKEGKITPRILQPGEREKALKKGIFLGFNSKKGFETETGWKANSEKVLKVCSRILVPNEDLGDVAILARNNVTEKNMIGDVEALKAMIALAKRFETDDNDRRETHLSAKVSKLIKDAKSGAEIMLKQAEAAKASASVNKDKATPNKARTNNRNKVPAKARKGVEGNAVAVH